MYARWKAPQDKRDSSGEDLPKVARVPEFEDAPATYSDEAEISLYDIWRVLRDYRAMLLGITLLAALLSGLAAMLMTPVYRAEVLLAPVTDLDERDRYLSPFRDFGNIATITGISLNRQDRRSESIATLKSRKFSEQFIQENRLDKLLFPSLWDEESQRWTVHKKEDIPTLWEAYEIFDGSVRHIREDRNTGLVTLSIEWKDPEVAAQWANELVSSVNATLRRKAVEISEQAIAYLQEQLNRTSVVELQQVLHRLIEAEMKKIIFANINAEFAFKVIDPATVPEEPFKPRVLLLVVLSITIGLMVGVILALIFNAVRTRPETA